MKNYMPIVVDGHHVDNMELFERGKAGEYHMCECRQNHDAFSNRSSFMAHIKLKCHQYWLTTLELPVTMNPLTLKEEQDSEYERALKEDQKKTMDKQEEEMRQIMQASEEAYQKETEERVLQEKRKMVETLDSGYTIRFVFPNGKKLAAKIPAENTIAFMRNHVDVYMADSSISISKYEFFVYPNKTLNESLMIKDALSHRSTVYIRNLDS
jgi:hypothetical protein